MGLEQNAYLKGSVVFGCKRCNTHMATREAIVSKVRPDLFVAAVVYLLSPVLSCSSLS